MNNKENHHLLYFFGKGVLNNLEVGEVLMHIRKGDATSPAFGISDWKAILEFNVYGDPSISLFGQDPLYKSDVVFLLDGSGSMVSPEPGKWQAASDAAVLFYDLMKALRHPAYDDRYNSVVFRWLKPADIDGTTAVPSPGLKDMTIALTNATFNPAFTPEPAFRTPMGLGLELAASQFTSGSEDDLYTDKLIILLSDGKHNEGVDPLDVVQSTDWPGAVRVYSVGLGEDDIEPETIEQIANATYGEYRISPSPREIEGFFCEILCDVSWKLQDVTVSGDSAPVDQNKAVFVAVWDDPAAALSFDLNVPDGTTLTPAAPGPHCSYHPAAAGQTHAFYSCDGLPDAQLGAWQFANLNDGGAAVPLSDVLLKVIVDPRTIATFGIENGDHYTGQPMVLTARITEEARPKTGLSQVSAKLIGAPATAIGSLMAQNRPPDDYPAKPPTGSDLTAGRHYLMGVMKKLGIKRLSKATASQIILRDDGVGFDAHKDDGIYSGVFTAADVEGSYTFRFRARGKNSAGKLFDRTETRSVYVRFNPSATATKVEMVDQAAAGNMLVISTLRITPRSASGDYLGPFQGKLIQVWSNVGRLRGGFKDNRDGSYDFKLVHPRETRPRVSVAVGDRIMADRKAIALKPGIRSIGKVGGSDLEKGRKAPPGKQAQLWPWWYSVLLILAILLIGLMIRAVLRKQTGSKS